MREVKNYQKAFQKTGADRAGDIFALAGRRIGLRNRRDRIFDGITAKLNRFQAAQQYLRAPIHGRVRRRNRFEMSRRNTMVIGERPGEDDREIERRVHNEIGFERLLPGDGNFGFEDGDRSSESSLNSLGCPRIGVRGGIVELDCLSRIIYYNHEAGEKVRSQSSLVRYTHL